MSEYVFNPDKISSYLTDMYIKSGLKKEDAKICSMLTVKSNLWGIDSHGILRTPVYVERLIKKAINPNAEITTTKGNNGPIAVMDGDDGMGYIVAYKAMNKAIENAKKHGIGMVLINKSNHFGAAGLYVDLAAEAGMLGIATTNVIPNIGMPGTTKPSTGNNPIALGAPLGSEHNFVLDISMSAVAGGKLLLAIKENKKIPTTWAITKEGKETDDPKTGFDGILLPMGMHKGFGMSLFIDIITGVLSGGPFLNDLRSMYSNPDDPSLTTHLFFAIDPEYFMEKEVFYKRMEQWVCDIKATPMANIKEKQIIPGQLEFECARKRKKEGIRIPPELYKELKELEQRLEMKEKL